MEANTTTTGSWPGGRYVVGMDGSEHSQHALRAALSLAAITGAQIETVITYSYPAFYGQGYVPTDSDLEGDATGILEDALFAVVGATKPANLTTRVVQGLPTPTLLELSKPADLLILGSRGHGGFAGLLLGSVSAACAEHASCPVLIIHGTPTE